MTDLLARGLIMGISIAAPVGPISVLCIRNTVAKGWATGLASGLGAATADAVYGSIAGFGLTFISAFLVNQQDWIHLFGGLFLCYLGGRTFFAKPAHQSKPIVGSGPAGSYAATFLLTLANPMTILSFAAIFGGLGVADGGGDCASAAVMVLGVFLGSTLWWLTLSSVTSIFRKRIDLGALQWVNRVSGLVVTGFGVSAMAGLL